MALPARKAQMYIGIVRAAIKWHEAKYVHEQIAALKMLRRAVTRLKRARRNHDPHAPL